MGPGRWPSNQPTLRGWLCRSHNPQTNRAALRNIAGTPLAFTTGSNLRKLEAFAARAGEEAVGLVISDEMLFLWIPMQPALDGAADVHEVAEGGGPVTGFRTGVRQLPGADAVEEVLNVRNRFFGSLGGDGGCVFAQLRDVAGVIPPQDFDLSLVADEDGPEILHVPSGTSDLQVDSVGIAHRELALGTQFLRPDLHGTGVIRAQSALHLVEAVGSPAGDAPALAATIKLDEIAPAVHQLKIERAKLRLVAPLVPIHAGGQRIRGVPRFPDAARGEVAGEDGVDLSNGPVPHQFARVAVDGHGPLLGTGLDDPLVFMGRLDQRAPLGQREALWFLNVGVQPGLHGVDADEHPGVGGGFHKHGIQLLLFEHILVVLILVPFLPAGHLLCRLLNAVEVAIRHRDEFRPRQRLVLQNPTGSPAKPDEADLYPVVRAAAAVGTEDLRAEDHGKTNRCGGGSGVAQEFSSFHVVQGCGDVVAGRRVLCGEVLPIFRVYGSNGR